MNKITSAKTSRKQIPALIKIAEKLELFDVTKTVLDYGGGKYDLAKDYCEKIHNVDYRIIDPYNRPQVENKINHDYIDSIGGADLIILANVLNVVSDEREREFILSEVFSLAHEGSVLLVSIYNAPKTGYYIGGDLASGLGITGQPTRDGWQNCQPLKFYLDEVEDVWYNPTITNGIIVAYGGCL